MMGTNHPHSTRGKKRRDRQKSCSRCTMPSDVLFRVQFDESGMWYFVCEGCLPAIKDGNARYTYGGTWKARKR
jgi:hypothetical protein